MMSKKMSDIVLDIHIYDDVISEIISDNFDGYRYGTELIENYWGPFDDKKNETLSLEDKKEYLHITKEILNQLIYLRGNYEEMLENYKEENGLGLVDESDEELDVDSDEESDEELYVETDDKDEDDSNIERQRMCIDELIYTVENEYKHAIVMVGYHDKPGCLIPGYLVE